MPSYHISSSGKVVQCSSDPCKLHAGTDFQAANQAQANQIGQTIIANVYKNSDFSLSKNGETEKLEEKAPNTGNINTYRAIVRHSSDNPITNEADIQKQISEWVDSNNEFQNRILVNDSEASITTLHSMACEGMEESYNPSMRDLAKAALQYEHEHESVINDYKTFSREEMRANSRQAARILNGKVDLDAQWREQNGVSVEECESKIKGIEKELRDKSKYPVGSDARNSKLAEKKNLNSQLKMPTTVKNRIMRTAWNNASHYQRIKLMKEGDINTLKYANPNELASYIRHTRPPKAQLDACTSKEQRREAIRDYRFKKLDGIYEKNKSVFLNTVIAGAISDRDAKAWENKHRLMGKDNDLSSHKGENTPYSDAMRTANAFVQAKANPQGNSKYYPIKTRPDNEIRGSEAERKRKNYNRRQHYKYLDRVNKECAPARFKNADGSYEVEAYAAKLHSLPLYAQTSVFSSQQIPRKVVAEYLVQQNRAIEDKVNRGGHSRYHVVYGQNHKMEIKDKNTGETMSVPERLQPNHVNMFVLHNKYSEAFKDAEILSKTQKID